MGWCAGEIAFHRFEIGNLLPDSEHGIDRRMNDHTARVGLGLPVQQMKQHSDIIAHIATAPSVGFQEAVRSRLESASTLAVKPRRPASAATTPFRAAFAGLNAFVMVPRWIRRPLDSVEAKAQSIGRLFGRQSEQSAPRRRRSEGSSQTC